MSARVSLNRWRGVHIGEGVWIGYDAIIETSYPELVTIRDRAAVGIRSTIIAHNREQQGVIIEEDAVLGPEVIVLPTEVRSRCASRRAAVRLIGKVKYQQDGAGTENSARLNNHFVLQPGEVSIGSGRKCFVADLPEHRSLGS
jgi:UDP-3-O-[3-hydroxymyristoyl] glucosamine N-acyltransferase